MITDQTNRILEDLQADSERQSGHLTWDDVHQVVFSRSLSPVEAVAVWQEAAIRFSLVAEGNRENGPVTEKSNSHLTGDQERKLARRVAAGRTLLEADRIDALPLNLKAIICDEGKAASDRLILANTGLVGLAAEEFAERTTRLDRDDFFQEGILGLMRAIEKFDPDKGYRLTTYATWWIRQHMRRAMETKARTIRLPCHIEGALRDLKKKRFRLRQALDHSPTARELALELGCSEGDVNLLLRVEQDVELLEDRPLDSGTQFARHGTGGSNESGVLPEIERHELSSLIHERLKSLHRRSRFIILQRFELEGRSKYTLQQLGDKLNVTRERVRQIEVDCLARLSHGTQGRTLLEYLEG